MSSSNLALASEPEPTPTPPAQVERSARALIGWMKAEDAHRMLASTRRDTPTDVSDVEIARVARAAVSERGEGINQEELVTPRPPELESHVDALRATPEGARMFAEGWDVGLVDLTKVCGFQPLVFSEQAIERVAGVDGSDLVALAAVTLPLEGGAQLPVQFDPVHQAILVSSANPNLRVAGVAGPFPTGPGGPPAFGFAVAVSQSFLQVGRHRGRHYLRDGYHRAFGFLSRGISVVPAFVRDITAFEELVPDPRTMLPQDGYQGPRPPLLPDYLDDAVSVAVRHPAAHKLIVIQALELTPIG